MPACLSIAPRAFTRFLVSAARRGGARLGALRAALSQARRAARLRAEARQLDAAALRDLGLSRSDLMSFLSSPGCCNDGEGWRIRP
jgi:uncharacterized protein YjiS (DUF1127 family)